MEGKEGETPSKAISKPNKGKCLVCFDYFYTVCECPQCHSVGSRLCPSCAIQYFQAASKCMANCKTSRGGDTLFRGRRRKKEYLQNKPILKIAKEWNETHPEDQIPQEELKENAIGEEETFDDENDAYEQAREASMVQSGAIYEEYIEKRLVLADEQNPEHKKNREKSEALIKEMLEKEKEHKRKLEETEEREAKRRKMLEAKGQWTCNVCTFANEKDSLTCTMCRAERHKEAPLLSTSSEASTSSSPKEDRTDIDSGAYTGKSEITTVISTTTTTSSTTTADSETADVEVVGTVGVPYISIMNQAISPKDSTSARSHSSGKGKEKDKEKPSVSNLVGDTSEDAWTCHVCTLVNTLEDRVCTLCGTMFNIDQVSKALELKGLWACRECTLLNPVNQLKCKMCESERSHTRSVPLSPAAPPPPARSKRSQSSMDKKRKRSSVLPSNTLDRHGFYQARGSVGIVATGSKGPSNQSSNKILSHAAMPRSFESSNELGSFKKARKGKGREKLRSTECNVEVGSSSTAAASRFWTCNKCYCMNTQIKTICECCKTNRTDLKPLFE